jgi:hypothetical protein
MCGRTTYKLTWEEIVTLYRLTLGQPAVNSHARPGWRCDAQTFAAEKSGGCAPPRIPNLN